jgi:hypothetical protein
MAALDTYLITKADIQTYRPTAQLDDARIKPYILEAQRMDLKPVLNEAFYYAFVNDFNSLTGLMTTPEYEFLLSGGTYTYNSQTIQFDGIRPMLCYYALKRFVVNNPVHITRMGITTKNTDQSDPTDLKTIQAIANELLSVAVGYQEQVIKYLENNTSIFTIWNTGGASSNSARKTSFNFCKL